jgi:hypothetical protein
MPDNEPTPIPLRAHRKSPEPITFPANRPQVTLSDPALPISPAMANFIRQEITKALYAIGNYGDGAEPIIAEMTYEQFEAFMARVWEEE